MADCSHPSASFDRTLCACGSMHDYCDECGFPVDGCSVDDGESYRAMGELLGAPEKGTCAWWPCDLEAGHATRHGNRYHDHDGPCAPGGCGDLLRGLTPEQQKMVDGDGETKLEVHRFPSLVRVPKRMWSVHFPATGETWECRKLRTLVWHLVKPRWLAVLQWEIEAAWYRLRYGEVD